MAVAALLAPGAAMAAPPTFNATLGYGSTQSDLVATGTITEGSAEYFEIWLNQPSGPPSNIQFASNPPGTDGSCAGGVQEGRAFVACTPLTPPAPAGTEMTIGFTLPAPHPENGGAQATMIAPPGGFANTRTIPVSGPAGVPTGGGPCSPDGSDRITVNLSPNSDSTLFVGEGGQLILQGGSGDDACGVSSDQLQGGTVTGADGNERFTARADGPGGLLAGTFDIDLGAGDDTLLVSTTKEDDVAKWGIPSLEIDLGRRLVLGLEAKEMENIVITFFGGADIFGIASNGSRGSATGLDVPLTLAGGGGADKLTGGNGNDKVSGGGADDRLKGRGGKDRINGGSGDDRCNGGPGKDTEKSC